MEKKKNNIISQKFNQLEKDISRLSIIRILGDGARESRKNA
jgi:hypothetical protein